MRFFTLTTALALTGAALSAALPANALLPNGNAARLNSPTIPTTIHRRDGTAADTLRVIMPKSVSCDGRGDECTTADVAAPHLVESMNKYKVTTGIEQAGILALIAYESVELQYKENTIEAHRAAGQGTANEESGDFNVEYANSIPELAKLNLNTSNVLQYVTKDQYNFATGAWYYTSQDACASARTMAANGSTAWEWFQEYMGGCDGVPLTSVPTEISGRIGYWNNALEAFGISNDTTSR